MRFGLPIVATGSLAAGAASLYYATYAVRSQWLGPDVLAGPNRHERLAPITFDDGPSPDTEGLLDVLAEKHLHATFFMVGREVECFRGIAQRVSAEGHEVGNHSYSHPLYLLQRSSKNALSSGARSGCNRRNCWRETKAGAATLRRAHAGLLPSDERTWPANSAMGLWLAFDWQQNGPTQIAQKVLRQGLSLAQSFCCTMAIVRERKTGRIPWPHCH